MFGWHDFYTFNNHSGNNSIIYLYADINYPPGPYNKFYLNVFQYLGKHYGVLDKLNASTMYFSQSIASHICSGTRECGTYTYDILMKFFKLSPGLRACYQGYSLTLPKNLCLNFAQKMAQLTRYNFLSEWRTCCNGTWGEYTELCASLPPAVEPDLTPLVVPMKHQFLEPSALGSLRATSHLVENQACKFGYSPQKALLARYAFFYSLLTCYCAYLNYLATPTCSDGVYERSKIPNTFGQTIADLFILLLIPALLCIIKHIGDELQKSGYIKSARFLSTLSTQDGLFTCGYFAYKDNASHAMIFVQATAGAIVENVITKGPALARQASSLIKPKSA